MWLCPGTNLAGPTLVPVKYLIRLLALLGVAFLAVCSMLFFVRADRAADAERHMTAVPGTVIRLDQAHQSDVRDLFRRRSSQVPVVSFTVNGTQKVVPIDSARGRHRLGDRVPIIYDANDPLDPNDDLVLIKGQDISALRTVAAAFAVAAALAAWVFVVLGFLQGRRSHDDRHTGTRQGQRHRTSPAATASDAALSRRPVATAGTH